MLGCFRKGEAVDPKTFTVAAVGILLKYPREIIEKVTDPVDGLPANSIFLPSLAELKMACDKEHKWILEREERQRRIEKQFREREADLVPTERLKAMGRAWLDRSDVAAQQLTREKPKVVLNEEQKKAALEDAAKVGRELHGMVLLPETLEIIRHHDNLTAEATGASAETRKQDDLPDDEIPF